MGRLLAIALFLVAFFGGTHVFAQKRPDSIIVKSATSGSTKNLIKLDTSAKKFNPHKATMRSLIIPGWGQAYNKKYWKIPIIYGALGVTAGIFVYNIKTYKLLRKAYIIRSDTIPSNDNQIDPRFVNLSNESIRQYRNAFRQNMDYSVLFFIIFWGLNVVDATVDAHLKGFDVNDNISLRLKPRYDFMTRSAGLSFVFNIRDKKQVHSKLY